MLLFSNRKLQRYEKNEKAASKFLETAFVFSNDWFYSTSSFCTFSITTFPL